MSEKAENHIENTDTVDTTDKVELGYPIIRKCISQHNLERQAERIFEYCDTLDEPLFVEKDGKLDLVIMSKGYYIKSGFDEISPFPSDEEIAAALAENGAEA